MTALSSLLAKKHWWFSLLLLLGYLLTFQLWLAFPSRRVFLSVGSCSVIAMSAGLWWAARKGYFVNRSDLVLHGLVIVDVTLEAASFEAFHVVSQCVLCTPGDPAIFHNSYSFCWCSAILAALVGGHHGWMLYVSRELTERTQVDPDPSAADPSAAGPQVTDSQAGDGLEPAVHDILEFTAASVDRDAEN